MQKHILLIQHVTTIYNFPLSKRELDRVLSTVFKSSPGHDMIPYEIINISKALTNLNSYVLITMFGPKESSLQIEMNQLLSLYLKKGKTLFKCPVIDQHCFPAL